MTKQPKFSWKKYDVFVMIGGKEEQVFKDRPARTPEEAIAAAQLWMLSNAKPVPALTDFRTVEITDAPT